MGESLGGELEGITVVSLEQAVAAPYAGLLLADAGARVIKVERPEGDFARGYDAGAGGHSTIFAWLNRGKESIALDLKSPDDAALLRVMLEQADVLLSNLAPGALSRLGLERTMLQETNPGLIICTLSGYGEDGAGATRKAYDFLVQAESGVCAVTGTPDSPARVGVPLTDLATGLTAFSAILRALIKRGRTGRGADIRLSMFDVMADWMNMPLLAHRYMGGAPKRSGLQHSFIAPYGAFNCKGGAQVLLSVQSNREWQALCSQVLNRPDLSADLRFVDNPSRYANRTEVDALLNSVFEGLERSEVISRLDAARIANASLNAVAELSEHPLMREAEARIAGNALRFPALPVASAPATPQDVPALDAQGGAIRAEFSVGESGGL